MERQEIAGFRGFMASNVIDGSVDAAGGELGSDASSARKQQ
jgi:hypothetical protein